MSHVTPETKCPSCEHKIDRATAVNGEREPGPGDISVCFYCGSINIYTEAMILRKIKPEEMDALDDETQMQLTQAAFMVRMRNSD